MICRAGGQLSKFPFRRLTPLFRSDDRFATVCVTLHADSLDIKPSIHPGCYSPGRGIFHRLCVSRPGIGRLFGDSSDIHEARRWTHRDAADSARARGISRTIGSPRKIDNLTGFRNTKAVAVAVADCGIESEPLFAAVLLLRAAPLVVSSIVEQRDRS